jgi:MFS family permease
VPMTSTQRWLLALVSVGSLMVVLDMLVVTTALNTIRIELGASIEELEWTINAFTVTFAVLLMPASALGDRLGRKRLLIAGLGLFTVASVACALAPGAGWLIAARAAQGVGSAMIMPHAMALLSVAFPPAQRAKALGLFSSVTGLGTLGGPLAGPVLEAGGTLAAGALLMIAFVVWELRAREPMLPMRLFRVAAFSAGNAASFLLNGAMFGTAFFLAQFLQITLHYGPWGAGVRLAPWTAAVFVVSMIAGALVNRIGERALIIGGLTLQAVGFGWIAMIVGPDLDYLEMIAPLLVAGCGTSLAIPAAQNAVIGSVPQASVGAAAGVFNALRQLGGTFGIAILAAVFAGSGTYASPQAFNDGFIPAMVVAAGLTVAAAIAGLWTPGGRSAQVATVPVGT